MDKIKNFTAPTLTSAEFKSQIIGFIRNPDFKAELLHQILAELPEDKLALFTSYRTDISTDPIRHDPMEWERSSYFLKQVHIAEKNFCLERIKHLIEVKSYLTERRVAGFLSSTSNPAASHKNTPSTKENTMNADFSSVDTTGFSPSHSLKNSVNNDDISSIRNALFMEMNDDHLSTAALRKTIAWTLSEHPKLFVPYEENAYSQGMVHDSAKWDLHYYGMQEVYASSNFSLERIHHMVAVRDHVFTLPSNQASAAPMRSTPSRSTSQPTTRHQKTPEIGGRQHHTNSKSQKSVLNSMLMIGGAVAAIALVILAVIV